MADAEPDGKILREGKKMRQRHQAHLGASIYHPFSARIGENCCG